MQMLINYSKVILTAEHCLQGHTQAKECQPDLRVHEDVRISILAAVEPCVLTILQDYKSCDYT